MKEPTLSVITVWDSGDTIAQTMEVNRRWFVAHDLEILVVNGGSDRQRLRDLLAKAKLPRTGMINLHDKCNHGLGVNLAMCFSRSPNLLILGPNHVLQSDLIDKAILLLKDNVYVMAKTVSAPGIEGYWRRIKEGPGSGEEISHVVTRRVLKAVFSDGTELEVESMVSNLVQNTKSATSILAVKKRDLGRIGGYNSDIRWAELMNADVQLRLRKVSGLKRVQDGEVLRLMGPEAATGTAHSPKDEILDLNFVCERYSRSDLWGTYSRDFVSWKDKMKLEWIH
jgi:hypothetical protein